MKQTIEYYVRENENMIYSLINKYGAYGLMDDLYQVSMVGLMEAYKRFDETRCVKFSTYAYPYILGEIRKYLRDNYSLKISRDVLSLGYKLNKAAELLTNKWGREPNLEELSEYLKIDYMKLVEAKNAVLFVKSIDEPISMEEGKEITLADMIAAQEHIDKNDLIWLKEELSKLPKDERELLVMRYLKDKTQQEVADTMGMSQVQVSRNEQRVLSKIRNCI